MGRLDSRCLNFRFDDHQYVRKLRLAGCIFLRLYVQIAVMFFLFSVCVGAYFRNCFLSSGVSGLSARGDCGRRVDPPPQRGVAVRSRLGAPGGICGKAGRAYAEVNES